MEHDQKVNAGYFSQLDGGVKESQESLMQSLRKSLNFGNINLSKNQSRGSKAVSPTIFENKKILGAISPLRTRDDQVERQKSSRSTKSKKSSRSQKSNRSVKSGKSNRSNKVSKSKSPGIQNPFTFVSKYDPKAHINELQRKYDELKLKKQKMLKNLLSESYQTNNTSEQQTNMTKISKNNPMHHTQD